MGPADRELMDEDDTQSFEALELRLKTPMRPVPKSRVGADEACSQVKGRFRRPKTILGLYPGPG